MTPDIVINKKVASARNRASGNLLKKNGDRVKIGVSLFTRVIYGIIALLLFIVSVAIIAWSMYGLLNDLSTSTPFIDNFILLMLKPVSSIIIAAAIIDVGKYIVEEEVYKYKPLRKPKEARETITKIMTIISIAVGIEGLVYIFKAGTKSMELLIYPTILVLSSVMVIVGLGIFLKMSKESDK